VRKADLGQQVRAIYEERPYPNPGQSSIVQSAKCLPPFEWIRAMCAMPDLSPRRILVAGCGTGSEAFTLKKRFPNAQITAVDFSSRSIAQAKAVQQRVRCGSSIRFLIGDLTEERFMRSLGRQFDYISCHGVLSYIPRPVEMLRNIRRGLHEHGVLYLGVNSAAHFSAKGRPALRSLGFNLKTMPAEQELRRVLRLFDALGAADDNGKAKLPLNYLAGDLFGPLIHNLPLRRWVELCQDAGLSFAGHYFAFRKLREAINEDLLDALTPWNRIKVYMLIDLLHPCGFHQMIFTRRPMLSPNWRKEIMLNLRPLVTRLYRIVAGKRRKLLRLESEPINTVVEIDSAKWEHQFLKRSTGDGTVAEILRQLPERPGWDQLRKRLYLFYQLGVINLEKAS
jgi:SAM-dependent methyltransferase